MTYWTHGETITVLRETRNRFGDITLVEDGHIDNCGWSPSVRGESRSVETDSSQVITGRTLYLPPNSGLTASHRVKFPDDTVWEVVGEIGPWRSFLTGWHPGDQAELQKVMG